MVTRRLATAVLVHRPAGSVMLPAGSVPEPEDAELITNPACWTHEPGAHEADPGTGTDEGTGPMPTPDETWKVADLRAWAEHHGIDIGPAKTKDDILMVITDTLAGQGDDDHVGDQH